MKFLVRLLYWLLLIISTIMVHISLLYFLPQPFNAINTAFIVITLIILFGKRGSIVWVAFSCGFLLDIYSSTLFGTYIVSFTLSTLIMYWFYRDIFTNKSTWSAIATSIIGLVVLRAIYTLSFVISEEIIWRDMFIYYGWEILETSLIIVCIHILMIRFIVKYKPNYADAF